MAVLASSTPQRKRSKNSRSSTSRWRVSRRKRRFCTFSGREDEPIVLDHHSPVLQLIQQIRDETHRFAVTFHRQRRSSRRLRTSLTEIPGVGERTARKLLRQFGSVARLKELTVEEIAAELPRAQAQRSFTPVCAALRQTNRPLIECSPESCGSSLPALLATPQTAMLL